MAQGALNKGRVSQPRGPNPLNGGHPLARYCVFAAYPVGNGFYDAVSRQFASNAGVTQSIVRPVDGNNSASVLAASSASVSFPKQTQLDKLASAFTVFCEGSEGASQVGGQIVRSYDSGNGYGLDLRYDDGTTAFDSFNVYTGNSVNTGYNGSGNANRALADGVIVTNGNSYKFARHFAIAVDASGNITWYSLNKIFATAAWGANRLPQASVNRLTTMQLNANNKTGLVLAFNKVLSLKEYQTIQANPWALFLNASASRNNFAFLPNAVSIVEAGSATDSSSSTISTSASVTEAASATDLSFPGNMGSVTETASATDTPSATEVTSANVSEAGSATDSSNGTYTYNQSMTDNVTAMSFGQSGKYYEPADGVASVSTASTSSNFVGSIAGTTLTVASTNTGAVATGQTLSGTGIAPHTVVGSGSGTTWNVSPSQTVSSTTMIGGLNVWGGLAYTDNSTYVSLQWQDYIMTVGNLGAGASGFAQPDYQCLPASITGSIAGTTLTVASVAAADQYGTPYVLVNQVIAQGGATLSGSPKITSQLTGTANGVGTYQITNANSVSIPSTTALTLSFQGGLAYPGQYWESTGKGLPGDAGLFSDAQQSSGTSNVHVIQRMDAGAFTLNQFGYAPNSHYSSNGNCYVKINTYTGTPVTIANNTVSTTGATLHSSGWVNNSTGAFKDFTVADVTWLSGSDWSNITSYTLECYGYAKGNIVGGSASNSPYFVLAYPVMAKASTAAESSNSTITPGGVVTEAASATDTISAIESTSAAQTEAASATDTASGATSTNSAVTEAASATDTVVSGSVVMASQADAGSATDTSTAANSTSAAVTEAASATDSSSALDTVNAAITEAGNAQDLVNFTAGVNAAIVEAAAANDAVTAGFIGNAYVVEAANAQDLSSARTGNAPVSTDRVYKVMLDSSGYVPGAPGPSQVAFHMDGLLRPVIDVALGSFLDYHLDFSAVLANYGDSIVSYTLNPKGCTASNGSVSNNVVTFWRQDGRLGHLSSVTVTITTDSVPARVLPVTVFFHMVSE